MRGGMIFFYPGTSAMWQPVAVELGLQDERNQRRERPPFGGGRGGSEVGALGKRFHKSASLVRSHTSGEG